VVRVEDLALVEAERLHDVLVGVRVDRLLEGLAQQELAALGSGDVPVGAQHDVVRGQRVGSHEEAEVALDQATLVVGQAVRVLPERDVAAHVDFLRHPVVGAGGQVLLPGPLVLERHQLVDVGAAVDDPLVFDAHAAVALGNLGAVVRAAVGMKRRGNGDLVGGGRRGRRAHRLEGRHRRLWGRATRRCGRNRIVPGKHLRSRINTWI